MTITVDFTTVLKNGKSFLRLLFCPKILFVLKIRMTYSPHEPTKGIGSADSE